VVDWSASLVALSELLQPACSCVTHTQLHTLPELPGGCHRAGPAGAAQRDAECKLAMLLCTPTQASLNAL
jgi:hypothetical protein